MRPQQIGQRGRIGPGTRLFQLDMRGAKVPEGELPADLLDHAAAKGRRLSAFAGPAQALDAFRLGLPQVARGDRGGPGFPWILPDPEDKVSASEESAGKEHGQELHSRD